MLDHPVRTRGVSDRGCVFAVADGVSTVEDGHWASRLTISRLSQFFDSHLDPTPTAMVSLISEIDWEIRGERQGKAACTVGATGGCYSSCVLQCVPECLERLAGV